MSESRPSAGSPETGISVTVALWVGAATALVVGTVSIWLWDRVSLWTQIVLISLGASGIALVIGAAAVGLRRRSGPRLVESTTQAAPRLFLYVAMGLAAITIFFVGSILILNVADIDLPEFILPMLLIGGVVAMLVTIAVVAVVFDQFKLSDRTAALALPEGSVRAIIALLLILIFAIMVLFLYATLLKGNKSEARGVTQEQLQVLSAREGVQVLTVVEVGTDEVGDPIFNVEFTVPANSVAQDFAKQVLTTVSTLVVAISAFYFGTKSVPGTAGGGELQTLRIVSPKSPAEHPSAGQKLKILLDVAPKGAKVSHEVLVGRGEVKPISDDFTQWEWTPGVPPERTVILFFLTDYPDVAQRLEIKAT